MDRWPPNSNSRLERRLRLSKVVVLGRRPNRTWPIGADALAALLLRGTRAESNLRRGASMRAQLSRSAVSNAYWSHWIVPLSLLSRKYIRSTDQLQFSLLIPLLRRAILYLCTPMFHLVGRRRSGFEISRLNHSSMDHNSDFVGKPLACGKNDH